MYLTEYLKMRGVKANALTNAEAALLGIDITAKGWVESDADVRREVEAASKALGRAYQLIGGFAHKD